LVNALISRHLLDLNYNLRMAFCSYCHQMKSYLHFESCQSLQYNFHSPMVTLKMSKINLFFRFCNILISYYQNRFYHVDFLLFTACFHQNQIRINIYLTFLSFCALCYCQFYYFFLKTNFFFILKNSSIACHFGHYL
jgi:hypothetical protein